MSVMRALKKKAEKVKMKMTNKMMEKWVMVKVKSKVKIMMMKEIMDNTNSIWLT